MHVVEGIALLGHVVLQQLLLKLAGFGAVESDQVDDVVAVGLVRLQQLVVHCAAPFDQDVVVLALLAAEDGTDDLQALLHYVLVILLGGEQFDQVEESPVVEVIGDVLAIEQQDINVGVINLLIDFNRLHHAVQVTTFQHHFDIGLTRVDAHNDLIDVCIDFLVPVHRHHNVGQY